MSWCIRGLCEADLRRGRGRRDRRGQQQGQILLSGPCSCCCETEGVAVPIATHQVSQNRYFLEAQRPHHRRRVRLPTQSRCRSEGDCGDKRPPGATTRRRAAPPSTGLVECTGKSPPSLQRTRPAKQFSDCRPSAPIPCLRIPTAGASEHQESNSHLPRGKGGWYLYLLLVCQVW